ncbi:MAG: amino acid permease, partial [Acinetobacter sp.]|uniref:amino acid permease n=1 Tax=Acinetobacter sp. TaxID=472 RepID=UPI002818D60C
CVTPWDQINPKVSPFVNIFSQAGIASAAIIMNLVVLSSVMSSMNSGVFSTSRMLFGLSTDQQAPKLFGKLSKSAVPSKALIFSSICIFIGAFVQFVYKLQTGTNDEVTAFTLATTLSTILFICVWIIIMWSYINYRRNRPELHAQSSFKLPGGVFTCWVVILFFLATIYFLALDETTLESLKVSPIWFVILAIGYFFYRNK